MVRKRTRKYESDDNDSDSDVEFDFEHQSRPAPKKYSLRERKKTPLLADDFDYYGLDEEDGDGKKPSSDDEDFEVEPDTNGARTYFEPEADVDPQNSEGLIDFEDIIRADIVVNRHKIDYDNVIQKTEIKLTQPKRRGRKPKNRADDSVKKEGTETNNVSQSDQLSDTLGKIEKQENDAIGGDNYTNKETVVTVQPDITLVGLPNGDALNNIENGVTKEQGFGNDFPVLQNTFVETPPAQNSSEEQKHVQDEQKAAEEEEDDDVIVLGELKQDVIVLDD